MDGKKRFLVTGASGFLGYTLCKYLVDKNCHVRGADIYDFDYPDLKDEIDFWKGDIRNRKLMDKIMKNIDIVIHSAAALPLWSKDEIFSTNVKGTRNILQKGLGNEVEKVIFISSSSVYGIPENPPMDENSPLQAMEAYAESKIKAEKVCFEFRNKGLCVPVLRPKTFAGPYRLGVFQIINDWVKDGKNIPIIGDGNNRYQLLHINDLNEAIYVTSTTKNRKANDTFNVGAKKFSTLRGDLQKLLDYAGFGKKVIPIPSKLVVPTLKIFQKFNLSPLYEWIYEASDKDNYISVDKIQRKLSWEPEKSTSDVWIDTYKWYLEEKEKYEGRTGVTHRVPWKQGILKLFKILF